MATDYNRDHMQDVDVRDGAKLMPDLWGTNVTLEPRVLSDRATYTEPIEFLFLPPRTDSRVQTIVADHIP